MAKQTFTIGQALTAAQMTALQLNDYNQTVSAKVASYVLVAADAGTRITMSNAGATTITVNTSLFTAGDTLIITNIGAGACTITAGTATVSTASSLVLAQYDSGRLYFTSTGVAIWEKYQGATAAAALTARGCSLYKSAVQSTANAADVALTFDTEAFDTDAFHDNVTNNSRITIPAGLAGKYIITGAVSWAANATSQRNADIYINGSRTTTYSIQGYTSIENFVPILFITQLAVGDYVEIKATQYSGGALNVLSGLLLTKFQIAYLGA